jgi:hypothetical protein
MAHHENVSKLLQELRGYAEITNRRVPAGRGGALWAPVRPAVLQPFFVRRKVTVNGPDTPIQAEPVPIKRLPPPPRTLRASRLAPPL